MADVPLTKYLIEKINRTGCSFETGYLKVHNNCKIEPILMNHCSLDSSEICGIWVSQLPINYDYKNDSILNEDCFLKNSLVWAALLSLIFDSNVERISSPSSDLKTLIVANFSSYTGGVNFYEFKLKSDAQKPFENNWLIRKEYRELLLEGGRHFSGIEYRPTIEVPQNFYSAFSICKFSKYLDKYEITCENKSVSHNRYNGNKPIILQKTKSERRIQGKKNPSIAGLNYELPVENCVVDHYTCKNNEAKGFVSLNRQNSNSNVSLNTPSFACKPNRGAKQTQVTFTNNTIEANRCEEIRGAYIPASNKENHYTYCNFDDPRELYINNKLKIIENEVFNDRSNKFESEISQRIPLQEMPRQRFKINEQLEDIEIFDFADPKTPEHIKQMSFCKQQVNTQNSQVNLKFNKKIKKVFESEKEFEGKSINAANCNNSKIIEHNPNNPYSNLELSATLLEYQNEDENMLSFSSKAITKIDLSNLSKGNTFKNCLQSKISTMKSMNDFEITSKIDKSTASPNTRKIMKIQNQKIKNLQEKVSQLLNEKNQQSSSDNNSSSNLIDKNELLKFLTKFIPQINNKHEKCDSTTASEHCSQFGINDKNLVNLSNLIYCSDESKFKKFGIDSNISQYHHQSKSELIPSFYECNDVMDKNQAGINNSMVIKDDTQLKAYQSIYSSDIRKSERMNECATIFQSNLSKIDETAKYEDESSMSNQTYASCELNKLQLIQQIKDHRFVGGKMYSNLIPTTGHEFSTINEVQNSNDKLWDNNPSLKYVNRSDWTEEIPKIKYESTPDPTSEEENGMINSKFIFKRNY